MFSTKNIIIAVLAIGLVVFIVLYMKERKKQNPTSPLEILDDETGGSMGGGELGDKPSTADSGGMG